MILFSVILMQIGVYPNNTHKEKLEAINKTFNKREHQTTSTGKV